MTTTAAESLFGTAHPTRRRWEPLRAGIIGLFHYDEQVFTFHRGRLLLLGNNGSGKSMALEVLLPYVLDANLSPERLSTFGVQDRGMFLWLLGHDSNQERTNARGYVWVEFGRLTDDGVEYCTVGAGLQATRAGKRVLSWYFTTTGRVGIDFELGPAGSEPKSNVQLVQALADLGSRGLPGQVHPTPDAHRKEVNRVLFGLDDRQFESLRKTLLHLRKPKLSDKLSEDKLDELLRDSLPPVSEVVTNELADGFERLDRHRDVIAELTTAHAGLSELHHAYATYLEVVVARRAAEVVGALGRVDEKAKLAGAASGAQRQAQDDLAQAQHQLKLLRQEVRSLGTEIEAIKELDLYKKGGQLVPLLEKAVALRHAATGSRAQADQLAETAARLREEATAAEQATAAAVVTMDERAAAADRMAGRLAHDRLAAVAADLVANLDPSSPDGGPAVATLRGSVRERLDELDRLLGLVQRMRSAAQRLNTAQEATVRMKQRVEHAENEAEKAREFRRELLTAYLDSVTDWVGHSPQLVLGASPPPSWPLDLPGQAVTEWRRRAAEVRRTALAAEANALEKIPPIVESLGHRAAELIGRCSTLSAAWPGVWSSARDTRDTKIAFADEVRAWSTGLRELSAAAEVPEFLLKPAPRALTRMSVVEWASGAATTRAQEIEREAASIRTELTTATGTLDDTLAEHRRLASGGLPVLPVPHTRLAERLDREGLPFYLLVDFVPGLSQEPGQRALLEAALIGSGLADAWVFPDGTVAAGPDDEPLLDVTLTTGTVRAFTPLSAALCPDPALPPDGPVSAEVVRAVLARIGLLDSAHGDTDGLTVAWDGSWSAGPLRGAYRKQSVDLIGAGSREIVRLRQIALLEKEIATLERVCSSLRDRLRKTAEAAQRAEEERAAIPADDSVHIAEAAQAQVISEALALISRIAEDVNALSSAGRSAIATAQATFDALGLGFDRQAFPDVELPGFERDATAAITAMPGLVWSGHAEGPDTTALDVAASVVSTASAGWQALSDHAVEALSAVAVRVSELERQIQLQPSDKAVNDASYEVNVKVRIVQDRAADLTSAQRDESTAEKGHEDATLFATTALDIAGLAEHGERLDVIRTDTERFRSAAEDWINATVHSLGLALVSVTAVRNARAAEKISGDSIALAAEAEEAALLARNKYDDLNRQMGKPHQDLMARLDGLQSTLGDRARSVDTRAAAELELGRAVERTKHEACAAQDKLKEARAQLSAAAESLADVHRLGLLHLPGETEPPPPFGETLRTDQIETVCGWGRALVSKARRDVTHEESAQTTAGRVRTKVEPALSGHIVVRERVEHGVLALSGSLNGKERSLRDTLAALTRDLNQTEELLEKEEAELFERFLSDEVRLEVGERIHAARSLVDRMNALMSAHSTTSGYTFKLCWEPAPKCDVPADMMELLQKPEGTLYRSERDRLSDFYRRRIASTRVTPASEPWREQLATMLDYRLWHRFDLVTKQSGSTSWTKLDRRRHNAMSGGEKAVALHLPLFAAAATHCEASRIVVHENGRAGPGCPRLILLDEVFAGVDAKNRGALFDLITKLDLDLVATSESELGLHPELDGISIYNLVVEDALPGVLASRSIWDGTISHNMLDHDLDALT
ncbi:SbcC/MukB-like Walker B domain-containing protein [Amycolatopsis sp. TRM77291]